MEKRDTKVLENLDFTDIEQRKAFIHANESSLYFGTSVDGKEVIVQLDKGKGMTVKYLNEKNWYECINYDENGYRECDWLEPLTKE
jgi:hypothetical protein